MPLRTVLIALVLLAAAFAAAGPAVAQIAPGELVITVVDGATKAPVENAEVFLVGPVQTSALTPKAGLLRFEEAPSGIYRIKVQRRGYETATLNEVEVVDGRRVTVTVTLFASGLREIGHVQARSGATASTQDVNENSPVRRISDSLNDALGQLAGVSVNQSANSVDGSITISLRGMDESQTGVSVAGIKLTGASQGAVLRALGTDLFSGASVDFSGNAGAIAGQVNYRTLEPTKQWITRFTTGYSTYDRSSFVGAVSGSLGKLGIATQFAHRSTGSPFDGLVFGDQSGLTYEHDAGTRLTGEFVKLRYALTDKVTVNTGAIVSNRSAEQTCPLYTQELACGYGPGNSDNDRFRLASTGMQAQLGNVAFSANGSVYGGRYTQNRLHGIVAGVPAPSEDIYDYDGRSASASFNVTVRRHTLALGFDTSNARNVYTPVQLLYSAPAIQLEHSSSLNLTDTYKIGPKLSLRGGLSSATASGAGVSLLETVGANWKPNGSDTVDVNAQFGSAQPVGNGADTFSEPSLAAYTCNGITRVGGPGDANTKQSSASYNATWTHNWRAGSLTATAYHQLQAGQSFYAGVPLGSEPAGYLPPGYVDALRAAWSRPNSCAGIPFDPNTIYIAQSVAGTTRLYEGWSLSGRVAAGRNVVLFPNLATTGATILTADPRFTGPYSFIVPGWQLPNRPLHTASLTIDALQPHAKLEWIANAQYQGANNGRRLGAYTQINLGVTRALARGALTAFVSNLTNADSGIFWTTRYAYRLPLAGGGYAVQPANPLLPRSFTVQYSVRTTARPTAPAATASPTPRG
ncbi:MAG TPA: TonB-dependent receptor [Candidatus Elarobacter sp.]|nr:TonB-dependent receptor [Candidatus Elarobacter sp.]